MVRPKGERGSWFAVLRGNKIPCVHKCWAVGAWPLYRDPYVNENPRWRPFIAALERGEAILTEDELDKNGIPISRKGYRSLWSIGNVSVKDSVLEFEFLKRLEDFR